MIYSLGATGLAQACEIVWQLRGEAGKRQVKNAQVGVSHNLGLGGACVVTVFKKVIGDGSASSLINKSKRPYSLGAGIPKELAQEPSLVQGQARL